MPDGVAEIRVPAPGGRTIAAYVSGPEDAQPVVYVHGTPGSARGWDGFLATERPDLRQIAIDRPGFGASEPRVAEVTLEVQTGILEPFLPEAGERGAILVGHSLGGAVVADACTRFPDRVAGVVIAAGALDPDLEDIWLVQRLGRWPPFPWILPKGLHHANLELIAFEEELRALAPRLADVRCPVEIVHGTKDRQVPYANVAYMERALTNSATLRITMLEGMSHFLPWRAQDALWAAINRLATSSARQSAPGD